ncbi:hypothetical protein KTQ42_22725 [Noviherbaspirillum sp. L7-7A]|uniref:hypothetical protein n=1 Tax=Noviherbaspirillum sp. L7-7A TaxID=2850560 RepID=UPI001C2C5DB5|nr:hypothetical protein [Noviherbaspirillum sp. L7-7A]MBV0882095.1 hypothetical protein [Noviherbaspirillum sp. L7-7A]
MRLTHYVKGKRNVDVVPAGKPAIGRSAILACFPMDKAVAVQQRCHRKIFRTKPCLWLKKQTIAHWDALADEGKRAMILSFCYSKQSFQEQNS